MVRSASFFASHGPIEFSDSPDGLSTSAGRLLASEAFSYFMFSVGSRISF